LSFSCLNMRRRGKKQPTWATQLQHANTPMECVDWQIVLFFKDGARASRGGDKA
jgi:hypothetical protein